MIDPLKKAFVHSVICNSEFTRQVIDQTYRVQSTVLYPPATLFTPGDKQPYILAVGRFDGLLHHKRQDVLIKAFKSIHTSGWKLVLAGGLNADTDSLAPLQALAEGEDIDFVINPSFTQLSQLYSHASLFWHAAGFGVDETKEPEKVEHFGISTVEAMSAGAVPLVYNGGGQREIVTHGQNGYLWQTTDELINLTHELLKHSDQLAQMRKAAIATSTSFSTERFIHEFQVTYLG